MPKAKKTCRNCVLCENSEFGISSCKLWEGQNLKNIVFPDNRACKMITGPVNLRKGKPANPEHGDAPFCGDYPKCNNAEGCDSCGEFEKWLQKN